MSGTFCAKHPKGEFLAKGTGHFFPTEQHSLEQVMAMTMLIRDQALEYELLEKRKAMGADRYDEVWDGVYVMSPMANNDHQAFVAELTKTIGVAVDWKGLGRTLAGVNVSDRRDGWKDNYRTIKWDNQMGQVSLTSTQTNLSS